MKNKKTPVTLKLSPALTEKCKAFYDTENISDAIRNALADFLLLPPAEQKIDTFALHQITQNVEERRQTQSYSVRLPKPLFDIILTLSVNESVSETVSMILNRILYVAPQPIPSNTSNGSLLYVLGNKRNPQMQAAIKNIKETAKNVSWETSVETCAGGLGIYSNFRFAKNEILNDSDWMKMNLYRTVQENPRELIIQARALTVEQITFDRQKEIVKNTQPTSVVNYEVAASYLYLNINSYFSKGSTLDDDASDTRYRKALSAIMPLHQRLNAASKKATMLCNLDIFKIIEKYRKQDNVLFIVDPPYLNADLYNNEDTKFGQKEHKRLANLLRLVKQNNGNDFIYFCRITAPQRYQKDANAEAYNIHMLGCIDDLYYGNGFYYTDVALNDATIERIITSFEFDGAIPYGCERGQK